MLPDILTPFKHYNEETISGVLDGNVTPEDEDSETCPSEDTMIRWHHWFIINEFNIEGSYEVGRLQTAWIQRGTAGNRHFAAQSHEKFHAGCLG